MIDVIIEQAAIKEGFDFWTLDLQENDLEYNPNALKHRFLGKETYYAGFKWKIIGVEFYSIVKTKFVLQAKKID